MALLEEIIKIIEDKDINAFIHLLGTGELFELALPEITNLFTDPNANLIRMIIIATQNYDDELRRIQENYYDRIINFFVFNLRGLKSPNIRDCVLNIFNDSKITDYTLLLDSGFLLSVDYETLIDYFERKEIVFKNYLECLLKEYNKEEEWHDYDVVPYSPYFENINAYITESLKDQLINYMNKYDITFTHLLASLNWFKYFHIEKLKIIKRSISRKAVEIDTGSYNYEHEKIQALIEDLRWTIESFEDSNIKQLVPKKKEREKN